MDDRSQKARMLAGDLYLASDAELRADYARAQGLVAEFNATVASEDLLLRDVLGRLLGALGEDALIRPPFRCDYGENIRFGARSFANYGCTFLDVCPIAIGADVQIGPNVQILAATHPMDPDLRRTGLESGAPVTVHDGVWIGAGAILCPGITVGRDAVIGAGSVVTRDVPPGVFAAGNPARVIRPVT